MSGWNAMSYDGKDNVLRVVREQADRLFGMAEDPDAWQAPTACVGWTVRTWSATWSTPPRPTSSPSMQPAARAQAADALGLRIMAQRVNERATAFRGLSQQEMMERLRTDFSKMMEIFEALGPDEWTGLMVPTSTWGRCRRSSTRPSS